MLLKVNFFDKKHAHLHGIAFLQYRCNGYGSNRMPCISPNSTRPGDAGLSGTSSASAGSTTTWLLPVGYLRICSKSVAIAAGSKTASAFGCVSEMPGYAMIPDIGVIITCIFQSPDEPHGAYQRDQGCRAGDEARRRHDDFNNSFHDGFGLMLWRNRVRHCILDGRQ
mgnify:CR=1 FL=1